MIIVSMGAGLGNQMFEYAFFTHLKELYPEETIKVDTRFAFPLAHNGIEIFEIFNIEAEIATEKEVMDLTAGYGLNGLYDYIDNNIKIILQKIHNRIMGKPLTMRIQSDYTEYYPDYLNIKKMQSIYYLGPFANYHYFSEIEDIIKKKFCFPDFEDDRNKEYSDQMIKSNSISIHIRRGDYVNEGIELTKPEFYYKAISEIEKKVECPLYFVFSDDVEYARNILPKDKNIVFVEGNTGKNSFRDMQLMSLCKHNITANSTFSFWGAFLNRNNEKIVIAPNLAFTGGKYPFVCDDWILF